MIAAKASLRVAFFSVLMIVLATTTNAIMDKLAFHYHQSIFAQCPSLQQWLDPGVSWKNKWNHGDPAQGEAFFLSSTALVATTDAWHLCKALTILFILLAIMAPFTLLLDLRWTVWVLVLFGLKLLYGIVFECFFSHVLAR